MESVAADKTRRRIMELTHSRYHIKEDLKPQDVPSESFRQLKVD